MADKNSEIKLLKRSKQYMDAMARGADPFTGEISRDSIVSDERAQRCFKYISGVLDRLIKMGGFDYKSRPRLNKIEITREQFNSISFSDMPIGITELARRINDVIDIEFSDRATGAKLADMLCDLGYLSVVEDSKAKQINEKSRELELFTRQGSRFDAKEGKEVTYEQIMYGIRAQRFIAEQLIKKD